MIFENNLEMSIKYVSGLESDKCTMIMLDTNEQDIHQDIIETKPDFTKAVFKFIIESFNNSTHPKPRKPRFLRIQNENLAQRYRCIY